MPDCCGSWSPSLLRSAYARYAAAQTSAATVSAGCLFGGDMTTSHLHSKRCSEASVKVDGFWRILLVYRPSKLSLAA